MHTVSVLPTTSLRAASAWTRVKYPAAYSHRDSCRIFKHKGRVYLSNGYQPGNLLLRDLWMSTDAIDWICVNDDTPYLGWCPITSFGGRIVALGDKIMASEDDGVTFDIVLDNPPFAIPTTTVGTWQPLVRGTSLILIGANKCWWTTDLISWSSRTLPFFRNNFAIWDCGGYVYLAAGNNETPNSPAEVGYPGRTSFKDVWRVDDPIAGTWTRIVAEAPWAKRMWPGFALHGGEMVITGGYNNVTGATNFADTWASRDGVNWREIAIGAHYPHRHFPSVISQRGRLILNNGNQNPNVSPGTINDIWELK